MALVWNPPPPRTEQEEARELAEVISAASRSTPRLTCLKIAERILLAGWRRP